MPKVLIIDDDPMLQEVLQRLLAKVGFETTVASNGVEGLKSLHTNPVDLIIIDIVMPIKGGIDTIMELHRDFPQVKIIAISGKIDTSADSFIALTGQFGVQQIFHKPLHWEQFLDEVQKIVDA
jgi:DNA-binding response OmpR family regulator